MANARAGRGVDGTVGNMSMVYPFEVSVAGVSWRQSVVAKVSCGDVVEVRAEPDNEHDSNAMAVLRAGEKMGYLPKAVARRVRADGVLYMAGEVVSRGGAGAVEGVHIKVQPADMAANEVADGGIEEEEDIKERDVLVRGSGRRVGVLVGRNRERGEVVVATSAGEVAFRDELVVIAGAEA